MQSFCPLDAWRTLRDEPWRRYRHHLTTTEEHVMLQAALVVASLTARASAGDDVDTYLRVRLLPRSDSRRQDPAVVAFADAIEKVCLDLVGAVLDGEAA